MRVLKTDGHVVQLRFLPDGQRLIVGTTDSGGIVRFQLLTVATGDSVSLSLPKLQLRDWWYSGYGNAVAIHPTGDWFYLAWGARLFSFRVADGSPRIMPEGVEAQQVIVSPSGDQVLAARSNINGPKQLYSLKVAPEADVSGFQAPLPGLFRGLAGFLPDGERFVTAEERIRIRHAADGRELAAAKHKIAGVGQPQLSRDGRHVATIGYGSMYVVDLETLGKPRRIEGSGNFGNFVSFSFHPANGTLAVIHGGPTLVKIYSVATLGQVTTYKWKLGPLGAVTFSPDGLLGAAGSVDGRIVVWDAD